MTGGRSFPTRPLGGHCCPFCALSPTPPWPRPRTSAVTAGAHCAPPCQAGLGVSRRRPGCTSRLKDPRSPRQWPQTFVPSLAPVPWILALNTTNVWKPLRLGSPEPLALPRPLLPGPPKVPEPDT